MLWKHVCCRYVIVNTQHTGGDEANDDDDNNDNDNNNNNRRCNLMRQKFD